MVDFLKNMTIIEIIGQVVGFVGMFLGIASFQAKSRIGILTLQLSGALCWLIHFLLIGSLTGALMNAVAVLRNTVYSLRKNNTGVIKYLIPIFFSLLFTAACTLSYENVFSLFPLVACYVGTVAFYLTNLKALRLTALTMSLLWIVYDFIEFSVSGVLTEAFTIISIIIALIRFNNPKRKGENNA